MRSQAAAALWLDNGTSFDYRMAHEQTCVT